MQQRLFIILCLLFSLSMSAQAAQGNASSKKRFFGRKGAMYRVAFTDKRGCSYSLNHPHRFLSRRSIERRQRQGIAIDSTDLPVSARYLYQLSCLPLQIVGSSRWLNSVLVFCSDTTVARSIARLDFVKQTTCVWISPDSIIREPYHKSVQKEFNPWDSVATTIYGMAKEQLEMTGTLSLHQRGYKGKGISIAVLDGGFENVHHIKAFKNTHIKGTNDFVFPQSPSVYKEVDHGTKVLSVLAANAPHVMMGAAPDASYWLLRCEDQQSEQPVEEDYWVMAAEYADSVGVDIINSSLGYTQFDHHLGDHNLSEMDGNTAYISKAASMLADKGIILVSSAGNHGMGAWKKLSFPADAHDILTVGAITASRQNAPFSSVGPTQDGRIKPDVMALGSATWLLSGRGRLTQDMGTSFATPLISGLVACLWQAHPKKTAKEIIEIIRKSGDNYLTPNNIIGYGLPCISSPLTPRTE